MFLKCGLLGDKEEALKYATADLELEGEKDLHFTYHIAECYAVIGENTKALDLLEKSLKCFFPYRFLEMNPLLRNLKEEPRFKEILNKAKEKSENFEV